jgi:DNA-binding response OmpR family regulator
MKVLLVEDETDLGMAICRTLIQERYIVDWVKDGKEAWEYLDDQQVHYTVAIVDWMLPGQTGIQLCQRLRQQSNALPVLLLTAKDRMEDKIAGLDAGADDYLTKPFMMEELLARLRALQRRSPQLQPQYVQVGSLLLDYGARTFSWQPPQGANQVISLANKEFQLLEYFLKNAGKVLSRDQILRHLYTFDDERISNVVAAQVRLLRRKLSQYGCEDLIQTMPSGGYKLNPVYEESVI